MKELLKKIGGAIIYPLQWIVWKLFYYSLIYPFVLMYRHHKARKIETKIGSIGPVFRDAE